MLSRLMAIHLELFGDKIKLNYVLNEDAYRQYTVSICWRTVGLPCDTKLFCDSSRLATLRNI